MDRFNSALAEVQLKNKWSVSKFKTCVLYERSSPSLHSLPDISVDVVHDDVEPLLVHLEEGEVGDEESAHEEEGVHAEEGPVHDELVAPAAAAHVQLEKVVEGSKNEMFHDVSVWHWINEDWQV